MKPLGPFSPACHLSSVAFPFPDASVPFLGPLTIEKIPGREDGPSLIFVF